MCLDQLAYPPPVLESRVDFVVENAEGGEGDDAGDDELRQVVVLEDVVKVQTQVRGVDVDVTPIDNLRCVRFRIEPGNVFELGTLREVEIAKNVLPKIILFNLWKGPK